MLRSTKENQKKNLVTILVYPTLKKDEYLRFIFHYGKVKIGDKFTQQSFSQIFNEYDKIYNMRNAIILRERGGIAEVKI